MYDKAVEAFFVFDHCMKTKGSTLRILKLFLIRKSVLSILLGLILVATVFDIVVPIISQKLIDSLISFFKNGGGAPVAVLMFSAIGILVATLANRVLKSVYDYQLFKTVTGLEDGIRGEAFEKYLRLHVLYHHGVSSGQIIGRIERGATAIYSVLYDIFGQNLAPSFLVVGGVIITLLVKSPLMALVVFLPLPIYFLSVRKLTERIYSIERRSNERFEDISKHSYDVAGNVLTVKSFRKNLLNGRIKRHYLGAPGPFNTARNDCGAFWKTFKRSFPWLEGSASYFWVVFLFSTEQVRLENSSSISRFREWRMGRSRDCLSSSPGCAGIQRELKGCLS